MDSRKEMKRKRLWIVQQPRAALTKTQLRDRAKKAFKSGADAADRQYADMEALQEAMERFGPPKACNTDQGA